jgi:ABC-type transporter Mla subunit MlaD
MMNDEQISESNEQTNTQKLSEGDNVARAKAQLSEFVASAQQASENAKASEGNAKNVLNQLSQILAEAKDALNKISESTPQFAAAATDVELKRSAIATAATEIETKRSAVATHAQQVDDAQKRAAEVRGALDKLLVSANQTQSEADALKQATESAKSSATQADADIAAIKATVDENAKAVTAALAASNTASAKTKGLADKSETVEKRIRDYEAKLAELGTQCDAQLEAIKALLPGATGAGLASAFDKRRQTFLQPGIRWNQWFIGSIVTLAVITLASLIEAWFHVATMTYQQLLVMWLSRLPFAAALVWLAMHASRESALAKRLEEDYGFKASVASSFQGFQEQMTIVGGAAAANEPLKALCDATLAQITNPPGRIYEKHALIVSPTTELLKAAQMIVDAAKAGKLPVG